MEKNYRIKNSQPAAPAKPKLLKATIILMCAIAAFWALFAATWLFRDSDYRYFYAVTGTGYAIIIAVLAYLLNKRRVWAWWLTIIFAILNIILTFTDQVGWFDLIYLAPAVGLLVMVVLVKKQARASELVK